jgi:diguanylate cyclase (GGDEF)-like protein/PAS domain S-box-containing protein
METGHPRWTTDELLGEMAGARLVARTATAGPATLPLALASLGQNGEGGWETALADIHPPDRADLARTWWRSLEKPGIPQSVLVRQQGPEGWHTQRIVVLDVRHQPDLGVVLVGIHEVGPCPVPEPDPAEVCDAPSTDRAWFHRPTWVLQELDAVGLVVSTEGDVEEIFGRPAEELVGNAVLDHLHPDDHRADLEMWASLLEDQGGTRTILHRSLRPDGSHVWIESTVMNRLDAEGHGVMLAISHDVTERRSAERDLRTRALSDALTGLPNRTSIIDTVEVHLRAGPTTVAFLDLDGFKEVNDHLGHHTGDEVLAAIAMRLRSHLPPEITVGRWGGDEFVLAGSGPCEAVMARAIDAAFGGPIVLRGAQWHPRASWGTAEGGPGERPEDLVGAADSAMYRAKERGT